MNLWQNWLNALTQTQQSATQSATSNAAQMAQLTQQYASQWQQACQQWQQSIEGAWSSPASFWQTVASIQSARARCIAEICQQQPQYISQLFQCTSYPQLIECLSRWNGHTLTSLTNLNITTQAQRSHLWAQWQQQMPFATTSQAALSKMWNATSFWSNTQAASSFANFGNTSGSARAPQAQPQSQQQAQSQPKPQQAPQQQPQAAQQPVQQSQPVQQQPAQTATVQQASSSTAQQPASSTQQLNLMTNESPTISSTANSVMRASSGNTIAAAAARRSVVARRVANNRRRVAR